jgi:hypothetical protein
MSNNNLDDGQKTIKPMVKPLQAPIHRTVSTGYEQIPMPKQSELKTEQPKLSITAKTYIPKSLQVQQGNLEPKEEKPSNLGIGLGTVQGGNYVPKDLGYIKTSQPSMIPYTYLNHQQHAPNMFPNYHVASPNPVYGNPNKFAYPTMQPSYGPIYQMGTTIPPQQTPMTSGIGYNPNTSGTTPTKKFFNAEATPFIPKHLKQTGMSGPTQTSTTTNTPTTAIIIPEKEEPRKEDILIERPTEQKEESTIHVEPPVIERVTEKQPERIIEKIPEKQPEKTMEKGERFERLPERQFERQHERQVEIPSEKRPEKPTSKVGSLFDSTTSVPKTTIVKADKKPTPTVPVQQTKNKKEDFNKTIDELTKKMKQMEKEKFVDKPIMKPRDSARKPTAEEIYTREPQVEEVKEEVKEELKYTIERHYFLVREGAPIEESKNVYSFDYLFSFRNWQICTEKTLLSRDLLNNWDTMKENYEDVFSTSGGGGKGNRQSEKKFQKSSISQIESREPKTVAFKRANVSEHRPSITTDGIEQWGRKDLTQANKEAEEFRKKIEEEKVKDPIKNELTEFLNILTVDNYGEIKSSLFEKIRDNTEDQEKLLEVLFKKAVTEKSFVVLYAKLCKDLDKELPQKIESQESKTGKAPVKTSVFRSKLLEKCKNIFKSDKEKIEKEVKATDPDEKEMRIKNYILGNTNFIAELINNKILSRKVVFQCLNMLFQKIEKAEDTLLKQLNVESIVILLDKFGTLINRSDAKKGEEYDEFNKKVDDYLSKLDVIQDTDKDIPGHIKYKIINLIEKKKRGWEESKHDQSSKVKSIKEVHEEFENEQRGITTASKTGGGKLDQEIVNERVRSDLNEWKDYCKKGYSKRDYNWSITETLIKKHNNTIAEILYGFGESCIDFVGKADDIKYAYEYFLEFISYHSNKLTNSDKTEIVNVTIFFLTTLNDLSLDNNYLVDVWGGVFYLLEFYDIISYSDLDKLKDLNDDQINCLFEVLNKYLGYIDDNKRKDCIDRMLTVSLIKANKSTFLSTVSSD